MKQFGKILKFELKSYLKNKMFVGITVFLVLAISVVMFLPNIISAFKSDGDTDQTAERPVMLIYAEDEALTLTVREYFASAFIDYDVRVAEGNVDDV